jgi:hypothetical protein
LCFFICFGQTTEPIGFGRSTVREKANHAPKTAVRRATVIATMKTRSIIILDGFEALSHLGSKAEKKRSVAVRFPFCSAPHGAESGEIAPMPCQPLTGKIRLD